MNTVTWRYNHHPKDFGAKMFKGQTFQKFAKCMEGRKLFLFGAGNACKEFLSEYSNRFKIDGILENDSKKFGQKLGDLTIISLDELTRYSKDDIVILITSTNYDEEIGKQLQAKGYLYLYSIYTLEVNEKYRRNLFQKLHKKLFEYHFGLLSPHRTYYNYVIFHILACLRVLHFPPAYLPYKGLKKYKNLHKGERCFIIATGPSLTISDIETLNKNHEYTFSMNSIFNLFDQTDWKPDYYVIEDPKFNSYFDWKDEKYNLDQACKSTAFLPRAFKKNCSKFKKVQFYPISYLGHLMKHDDKKMKFSKNFIWGIYCAFTVTNVCIQLAQYMGFKEVYLLGVDCNYSGPAKHFAKEKDDAKYTDAYARQVYDNLIRGYDFTGKHVKALGTTVYNATRGGALEVFERIDFDKLFPNNI